MLTLLRRFGAAPEDGPGGGPSAVHSGNMGDIVYALPALRALGVRRLVLNVCRDPGIGGRSLSRGMAEFLAPLLLAQPGIETVDIAEVPVRLAPGFGARARSEVVSEGLPLEHVPAAALGVDHVLDRFRLQPLDRLHLIGAHARAVGVRVNGAAPYLVTPEPVRPRDDAPIVLSLTPRYRHQPPEFFAELLRGLGPVLLLGLPEDAVVYTGIAGELVTAADGLELARLIAGARAFVGAPSLPYAIAEGLKAPRLVDVPAFPANAFPLGDGGWVLPARPEAARRLLDAVLCDGGDGGRRAVAVARAAARDAVPVRSAPGPGHVKAYLRTAPHFAEPPAATAFLPLAPTPQRVELALPALAEEPKGLRFDVRGHAGLFDVVALRLLDGAGRELWRLAADEAMLCGCPRGDLSFLPGPGGRAAWVNADGMGWIELPVPGEALAGLRNGGRLVADLRAFSATESMALTAAAIAGRHAALAEREAALAREAAARREADEARAAFAATLADRDRLRGALTADLNLMRAERDCLKAERDNLLARLNALYRSTSWRVSAPLRVVMRLLRGRR